jgi:hypothetical protein
LKTEGLLEEAKKERKKERKKGKGKRGEGNDDMWSCYSVSPLYIEHIT